MKKEKIVMLDDDDPIVVELSAKKAGKVSLSIRINGSDEAILDTNVTLPTSGNSKKYSKTTREIVK